MHEHMGWLVVVSASGSMVTLDMLLRHLRAYAPGCQLLAGNKPSPAHAAARDGTLPVASKICQHLMDGLKAEMLHGSSPVLTH